MPQIPERSKHETTPGEALFLPQSNEKRKFKLPIADTTGQVPAKTSPKRPHTGLPVVSRKPDALFVKATVFGIDVECLVDTGSTATILHADKRHPPSSTLRMADGNLVKPLGTANFPLVIDNKE